MNRRSFLQTQIIETDRLLGLAGGHPVMGPGLRTRKAALEAELQNVPPEGPDASATLYFTGGPVFGSAGIDAEFAASILNPFTKMVKSQYASVKHGAVGERGPRRDEHESKLMLTSLPRGSFGLELKPLVEDAPQATALVAEVMTQLSDVIRASGESDQAFAEAVADISPRTLPSLRDLLKAIAEQQAELRMVTRGREIKLPRTQAGAAYDRVASTTQEQRTSWVPGVFRGLTLESWRFDFRPDEGDVITGRIGGEVEDLRAAAMVARTNQPCDAELRVTTTMSRAGVRSTRFELLALRDRQPLP